MKPPLLSRLVLTDAASGVPLAFGVMVTLAGLALALVLDDTSWGWADAWNSALVLLIYTGPLAFAAGAAHAGNLVRRGMLGLASTTGLGRWAPARLAALTSLSWAIAAWAVQTVVVLLRADPEGAFAAAFLVLPASALALTAACSLAGTAVGSRLTGLLVAPTGALLLFLGLFASTYAGDSDPSLSPVFNGVWFQPNTQPNVDLVLGQALVAGGIALGCVATLGRGVKHRLTVAGVALVVLLAGASSLGRAGASPVTYVKLTAPACAQRADISLCVWPQLADQLSGQLELLAEVTEQVEPYVSAPRQYRQVGLPATSAAPIVITVGDARSTALTKTVEAVLPRCAGGDVDVADALREWALVKLDADPTMADSPEATIAHASPARQQAWVDRQLRAMGC